MARQVKLFQKADYRAGLNLRADAFQLGEGESPSMLNVDVDPRGGFSMRGCVTPLNTSANFGSKPHSINTYATSTGTDQVLIGWSTYTSYSTGGSFTSTGIVWTSSNKQRGATFNDKFYVQNGVDAPKRWDGSTATNLTQTFNDTLSAPTSGNMPIAKCIAVYGGYCWIANTLETAVNFKNRVRFSFPMSPSAGTAGAGTAAAENWRTNDYIDIDIGHDGDEIVALVPWSDRLLVFKQRSVYAIVGFSPDTFQVIPISQTTGAISQEAVVATEHGVYWFGWPDGAFFYDGREVRWLFERIHPAILNGSILDSLQSKITVGFLRRRAWFAVPYGAATDNSRVFVFDPTLGKTGGWTFYDLAVGPMVEWKPTGSTTQSLACGINVNRVLRVGVDTDQDSYLSDYLTVTGASGSYAWAPDSAGLSIVGDIDLRAFVNLTDWTPASAQTLVAKWETTANQRSYRLYVDTAGKLNLDWSANGTAVITKTSTVTSGITDGTAKWVRATLDVDNGAAGNDVKFYTSDDAVTWTQLGATVTTAATTAIFDSSARATVAADLDNGSGQRMIGKFYQAQILQGLAGTYKGGPDFTTVQPTATTVVDTIPNTWTISSPAVLSGLSRNVQTYYYTKWYDAGSPAIKKRWRRPELVIDGDFNAMLQVDVYRDYDPLNPVRTFFVTAVATSTGSLWGATTWGGGTWGIGSTGAQEIVTGSPIGRGRAIQIRVTGPATSSRWGVNAISYKYIERVLR